MTTPLLLVLLAAAGGIAVGAALLLFAQGLLSNDFKPRKSTQILRASVAMVIGLGVWLTLLLIAMNTLTGADAPSGRL